MVYHTCLYRMFLYVIWLCENRGIDQVPAGRSSDRRYDHRSAWYISGDGTRLDTERLGQTIDHCRVRKTERHDKLQRQTELRRGCILCHTIQSQLCRFLCGSGISLHAISYSKRRKDLEAHPGCCHLDHADSNTFGISVTHRSFWTGGRNIFAGYTFTPLSEKNKNLCYHLHGSFHSPALGIYDSRF